MQRQQPPLSVQRIAVYRSDLFRVINGANLGDPLCFADELVPDDIYRLSAGAEEQLLGLSADHLPPFRIGADSDLGHPGAHVHLDCCLTFMTGDGSTTECLLLVEVDGTGGAANVYMMPLAAMDSSKDYVLVGIDRSLTMQKFAQAACVSFTSGTMITMASGAQKPVESLSVGDRVLTRDNGPQAIRWLGQMTCRAVGAFAPVVIKAGALHNLNDLVVSPDHRLFIYQRSDQLGAGRHELLVRARHLINGDTVFERSGGFVEYFQMLFDHHQIVFAEGIAAESMLVDPRTSAALPGDSDLSLDRLLPEHEHSDRPDLEVREPLLRGPDVAAVLRKSTTG